MNNYEKNPVEMDAGAVDWYGGRIWLSGPRTCQIRRPRQVEIRQTDGRWQLYVNQKPFYIKGAGLDFW